MNSCYAVGILDWGVGGLSVYRELKRQIKSNSYVYFSDSGFTPYGKAKKDQLIRRLNKILHFFRNQNIRTVVIACNAASTVIDQVQKQNPDLQLFGMLDAGKQAIEKSKKKSALVLGGRRTISSRFFQKSFLHSPIRLQTLVAQPLSALIEKGKHKDKVFAKEVSKLRILSVFQPEIVLLACTHYPAARSVFKKKFPSSQIIDPAQVLVQNIKKHLKGHGKLKTTQFFTTGSVAQSKVSAEKAFHIKIKNFQKIHIK